MKKYPLKLKHASSTAIWGGERLKNEWGKKSDLSPLAETWELSVREDGMMSYIENGEAFGLSLREYIEKVGNDTVFEGFSGERFPLLIKFIDAAKDLSVQVHPDDGYSARKENDLGKTEMWYIVDAKEGSKIVCGLKDGITREDFAKAVEKNDYGSVLKTVEVKKGESYFIPAGLPHAIGEGILIAEIQQNSDLTYRIYDYDRIGADGKKRELHVERALDVVRPFTDSEIESARYERGKANEEYLANSKYFSVRKLAFSGSMTLFAGKESFNCLLSLAGNATLTVGGEKYEIDKGDAWFIPAGFGEYHIFGNAEILLTTL